MLVAVVVILAVAVAALLAVVVNGRSTAARLEGERDDVQRQLDQTRTELGDTTEQLDTSNTALTVARADAKELETRRASLETSVKEVETKLIASQESLRKRTELADAQAMQIDAISAERDDLKQQLVEAEERIVTLAARPGVVVGGDGPPETVGDDTPIGDAATLWQLELARSERVWRNSVAINPMGDPSPFDSTDDPVRKAIEIEAAALREDVGALINVDWRAEPVTDPARRLMVVRVAQEMLATAAKAPGAATLVVENVPPEAKADGEGDGEADGQSPVSELTMRFESAAGDDEINLIPPQVSSDLIDVRNETTLTVKTSAE